MRTLSPLAAALAVSFLCLAPASADVLIDFGTDAGKFSKPGTGTGEFDYTFGNAGAKTITYAADHVQISGEFGAPFQVLGAGFGSGNPAHPLFNQVFNPDPSGLLTIEGRVVTPAPGAAPLDYFVIRLVLLNTGANPDRSSSYEFISSISTTPGDLGTDGSFKLAVALSDLANPSGTGGGGGLALGSDPIDQLQVFIQNGFQPDPGPQADPDDPFFNQPTPQSFTLQVDQISIVPIPEPAAATLLGAGSLLISLRRR